MSLETYYTALFPFVTRDEDFALRDLLMVTEAAAFGLLGVLGVTQDPANGGMVVTITGLGVTPVLEPTVGDEPWYLVGTEIARSETGTYALQSAAGISNVPPGEYVVTMENDTEDCSMFGWAAGSPNQLRVPILAGHLTSLFSVHCL